MWFALFDAVVNGIAYFSANSLLVCRNATDLCILICILNSLVMFYRFFWLVSLGLSVYKMYFANGDDFTFSF